MKPVFTLFGVRSSSPLFIVLVLLVAVIQPDYWQPDRRFVQAKGQDWPLIQLGQTVEKSLSVGETHKYRVKLEAGMFVLFEVGFVTGDMGLALYDSNGNLTYQQSRDARKASVGLQQTLRRVIESTDTYRLEISAKPEQKEALMYSLKITELRAANDGDQRLQTAELWQREASRLWDEQRSFDEGIALGEKALAVYQELSPTDADVGNVALLLQALYEKRAYHRDMERRRELVEIALHNREIVLGPNDSKVIELYFDLENLVGPAQSSKYFEKEMEMVMAAKGAKHPQVGNIMSNWSYHVYALGDKEKAEKMVEDAARIIEESDDPHLAGVYLNLGGYRLKRKDWAGAIWYTQKVPAIIEKHGDPDGLMTAVLSQFAEAYQLKGDFAQSDAYYQKLLDHCKAVGTPPRSPFWANAYVDMAKRQIARGRLDEAAKLYEQAKKVLDLTGDSPSLAGLLFEWSKLHLRMGQVNEAVVAQRRAAAISEIELQRLLAHGSESEKMKMLFLAATELAGALSLHADYAPKSDGALRLAFTMLLQRKGRVLDEMNRTIAFLRSSAKGESSELIERWINLASEISVVSSRRADNTNVAQVAQQTAHLGKLNKEFESLQLKIGARSPEFRAQVLPPVTLEDVQKAMPANSALIEFAQYIPENIRTNRKSEPRYLAYVLPKVGKPEYVPLEDVQKIDSAVRDLRQAFQSQGKEKEAKTDPRPLLRELDRLVMQKIRPLLGQAKTVFLAPDGELNLVPFAALRDEGGRYLLEDKLFVYLTSGRDLIRLQIKHQSQSDKLIFAINNFNTGTESALPIAKTAGETFQNSELSRTRGGRLSEDETMSTLSFKALEQARSEGETIGHIFPEAKLFVDEQAIETTLKQVHRPYWLHLATHGFFLPNPLQAGISRFENPLLRSGLALAGANARKSGKDDGILTAFEVAALDLWGTKMVVLSACETGNGEVKTGEGVMGLRRAFVLAGAETQVSSLWRASDDATPKLMQYFYSNLKANMGRAEALQQAQLKMLKQGITAEPYYWANFICIGEWKPLNQ